MRSEEKRRLFISLLTSSVTFDVWVVCTYKKGKRGKHGIEYFAYAVHQIQLSLKSIHEDYRLRFGIESSYRMKNQCRIKTTTKNPIVRFLFVSLAFLIVRSVDLFIMAVCQPF